MTTIALPTLNDEIGRTEFMTVAGGTERTAGNIPYNQIIDSWRSALKAAAPDRDNIVHIEQYNHVDDTIRFRFIGEADDSVKTKTV